jgi:EpsI family protein
MPPFLHSRPAQLATLFLLVQGVLFWGLANREEIVPAIQEMSTFPKVLGDWQGVQDNMMDAETAAVLQADQIFNRSYARPGSAVAPNLFIAAFRSQRSGRAPHSPRNCLPGNGWVPQVNDRVYMNVPGRADAIEVNRFIVQRGDYRSLVLYWYQSRDRIVANEYKAKFFVVADALRYNRTDTALVRVVVPLAGDNDAQAQEEAAKFIQAFYPQLKNYLPA